MAALRAAFCGYDYTGSVALRAPFSLCCRIAALRAVVFVVGLQPTIGGLAGTQGFVRLRLTTPCAKLWSPYRALLAASDFRLMAFLFRLMAFLFRLMAFLFRLAAL